MRCKLFKRATWLPALLVPAVFAANYSVTVTYEGGGLYYAIYNNEDGSWYTSKGQDCFDASKTFRVDLNSKDLNKYELNFYTDDACQGRLSSGAISMKELFPTSQQAKITVSADGSWAFTNGKKPGGGTTDPTDPWNPGGNPGEDDPGEDNPGGPGNPGKDDPETPVQNGMKVIAFFTPWTNTNAKLFFDGNSSLMVPVEEKYCGWFIAAVKAPAKNFDVYFKQTIGPNFVGAEGLTKSEPVAASEMISLDSVAALTDTIWVKGNQEGAPGIYTAHPAGVLGDCPIKKLPVMMFDWLHGGKGDGVRGNGSPEYGISADFGSGGCGGGNATRTYEGKSYRYMAGMVEKELGPNGVPVRATPFPEDCGITDHLDYWFIPESLAVDAQGNTLTNMTCRDLYISMDDEGFWLAEVSKDAISKGNEANKGGMFLLDDFQYLDSARMIPNPYYDQLSGGSDNRRHNFGFTMKVQATFEYVPGQYFDFLGDDDVWVFINNKLVVDIGGQHAQVPGAVDLDTLGLIPDSTYNFHIFYAERHTSLSNFRMRTSIDLKTEASIVLKNISGNSSVVSREIWQRVRKSKLSCDFSGGTELSLERGKSVFTLFGGNLPSTGVELDTAGVWFGGITIENSFDRFSVDKEAIKEARGLAPGVYYLRVALVSDNSQYKDVYFVVGAYSLPNIVFADSTGKSLGSTVQSDTLPLNMNKDLTMWVGQSYKVYVQYAEDWANDGDIVYPSTDDDVLIPCDSLGNPITEVRLESGRAEFYVKAVGETWGASLYVKGQAAGNTAVWKGINFALPPVPQIEAAYIYDRDGDGRSDSVWIQFDGELGGKNSLDSVKLTFGTVFNGNYKPVYKSGSTHAYVVAKGSGFGTNIFTGGVEKPYTGMVNVWYTYRDDGKVSVFPAEGRLLDQVGPVITAAEVSYMNDGNAVLQLSFSEGLDGEGATSDWFRFHCWKNGVVDSVVKSVSDISKMNAAQWKLIFPKGGESDLLPAVGDSVRFTPPSRGGAAKDLVGILPHENNAWIRITGEQKVTITSPGVVTLNPGSASYDSAKVIIRSDSATVPRLIKDESVLTAEQAASAYGTQGHFLGDLNLAELVENEIANIMKAVQGTSTYTDSKDDSEYARTYTIDEIIAMVDHDEMSIGEAKKRFGLDAVIVDAYENGMLNSGNVGMYSRGTESDIRQIVEAVAQNTELRYKTTYYSSLGEFVNSSSGFITCNGDVFKDNANAHGNCLDNNGKLYLAWNMRAKNGRLASTGVYIARLEYRIKVGSKTMVNRTQDFLWGVRRGKVNALDLGF